jgi:hypothetical protein
VAVDQQRCGQRAPHLQFQDGTGDGAAQSRFEQADRLQWVLAVKKHLDIGARPCGLTLGERAGGAILTSDRLLARGSDRYGDAAPWSPLR